DREVPPHHDQRVVGRAAVQDLVPADDLAALAGQILRELPGEPGRQVVDVGQSQLGGLGPGLRTVAPPGARYLVTADVDVLGVEDVHHGVEDLAGELQRRLGGGQDLGEDAEGGRHRHRLAGVAQLRVP